MAQTLAAEMTAGPDPVPVKLFRGYDRVARGMLTASAVTGGFEKDRVSSGVRVQVCESLSELADALDIDASLSVSYLKAVDVTAKMEFARKLNVTARSVTIVVYARHGIGTWDARDVTLKPNVKAPVDDASAKAFVKTYGDSFIRSVTLGGEYFAVFIFNTETREQQQKLAASIKGEGIGAATVSAEAQTKLTNFLKTTKTSWTLKQDMTGIVDPDYPDQDRLIPFALGFSKLPLDGAVVTNIEVTGYEDVEGFGDSFAKVVGNRGYFLDPDDGLLRYLARLSAARSQVGWLKRIYARYGYTGDSALTGFEGKVEGEIKAINKQIADWKSSAVSAFVRPEMKALDGGEPVLAFREAASPVWGGSGSGPWKVDSVGDLIRNRTRIKSIQIATGRFNGKDLLGRLIVEYDSDKRGWTESYGDGELKVLQPRLDIEEGQFPTGFEVRHGSMVDWLKIRLGDGLSTEAGGSGGAAQAWPVPEGHVVVGFAGRSGAAIDQLQVRLAKLEPAKMMKFD